MSRAAVALILASILWGTTGTAASFLPAEVSPLAVGSATMGVGGALLFAVSLRTSVSVLGDRAARRWLTVGAVGVVAYPLAFYAAMDTAGVVIGNVVALGSGPMFVAFFEWAWERRRPGRAWIACTLTAVSGIALLALGGSTRDDRSATSIISGVTLGLLAGIGYALYTYASSRAITLGLPSRGVMGGMFGLGSIGLLPVLILTGAPVLHSTLSLGISAYLAVAVVGERLAIVGWVGLALILAGVAAMSAARHPDK